MNLIEALQSVKKSAQVLRVSSRLARDSVFENLAALLQESEDVILAANHQDLEQLPESQGPAFRDRLSLSPARLLAMRESLRQIARLPDPVGEIVHEQVLKNGLLTRQVRSPLGVLFMIFESRPNVAIEAFSLALKSGNAILLRGGKESARTVSTFYSLMQKALRRAGLPADCVMGITDSDRALVLELLHAKKYIDVVIPRGGEKLIEFVVENSKIPIIKNDRGMCHIFVDADADQNSALLIIENAKKQRPGVCNAVETILVHELIAQKFLPLLHAQLATDAPLSWFVCPRSFKILSGFSQVHPAQPSSFDTEYLDLSLNCKVVENRSEAISHIEEHGSKHSEAILTASEESARQFQREVDAAAVYWNASTRFTDGFELGLGGELGISTQKLHVRGPVGLKELTSVRWIMDGNGQIRS